MFDVLIPLILRSKSLRNKNIVPFVKRTNFANYTIRKLAKIKKINKMFVLTDSKSYKKIIINHLKVDKGYIRKKKFSTLNSIINIKIRN
mgnify:CR=1 FL=1|tara:strand:+ start:2076 stop:2342 length:267 start_codon:yes stop_codon:yes gene_type:complete